MGIISSTASAFIRFEIENGDARRRKVALQEISRRYRRGDQLNSETRNAFEKLINGIVLTDSDKKVVRWCLNALARFGTRENCSRYVTLALQQYEGDPEIVAAAVAALSRMYNGDLALVPVLNSVDPAIRVLAAMQITDAKKLDLSNLNINIGRADPEVLKLALLTIGLNRDIQNLLHPRHSNGTIVKELCQHDDPIVRQYSVWSIMENRQLTLDNLGISFSHIASQPVNVQAKLLQLAAEREPDQYLRHQIIHDGTFNAHPEARLGLATGVSHIYYSGLEDVTLNWYDSEIDADIRALIAEHFAKFSEVCAPYSEKALSIIEAEPKLKERILVGAEGKALYGAIRIQEIRSGGSDLFGTPTDLGAMFQTSASLMELRQMKVLFLAANPVDQSSLKLDQEARDLKEQLGLVRDPKVIIDVEHAWAVRTDQLQREILNSRPDALHFSGHGDTGRLLFENFAGETVEVSGEALADLVSLIPAIECVVLNSCFSDSVAKLVAPHVDAVIGCDATIGDEAAIYFTRAFYRALAHGETIKQAFRLAKNDVELNGSKAEAAKYTIAAKP